ncbi:MAG: hypothetical protein HDR33_03150 [Treponema sp.]|nr:hypothetical protein [Treponema sp.]
MKKIALLVMLVSCVSLFPLAADDFTVEDAEPYDTKATPQWLKDLRRGEIITLGSWPFTLLLTAFGFSLGECFSHNFDSSYIKNPFVLSGSDYSRSETTRILLTSLGVSVGVGVVDLVVNIVRRKKAGKKNDSQQLDNITIIPLEGGRNLILQEKDSEIIFGNLESAVF